MSDEMKWGQGAEEAAAREEIPREDTENHLEETKTEKTEKTEIMHELEGLGNADIPWLNQIPEMNQRLRESQEAVNRQSMSQGESREAENRQSLNQSESRDVVQETVTGQDFANVQNAGAASNQAFVNPREIYRDSAAHTEDHPKDTQASGGGNGNGPVPPKYAHYEMHQGRRPDEPKPPVKHKKAGGFLGKLAGVVALGAVFGLVAGLVFQGVNLATGKYVQENQGVSVGMTETVPDQALDTQETASDHVDIEKIVAQNGSVAGVAEAALPSVVAITSVSIQEIPDFFSYYGFGGYSTREYPSTGSGSGIIVGENDDELLIATNNHVVEGATTLSVCFIGNDVVGAEEETQSLASGESDAIENAVTAKIKGTDPDNDLAVVSVEKADIPGDTMKEIKIAQLGSSDDLVVGEQVVAIGNALGYGQSVTSGWVSALNRAVTMEDGATAELIQTDAAINPGNSGGALLNMHGELIGINSAKYASSGVEGMGYAIPISKAQPILEELMTRKTREKVDSSKASYLGVKVADLSTEAIQMYNMPEGAFVTEVTSDSAAEKAGIQKSDIIVKLDGQKVTGRDDLIEKLTYYAAGEEVEIVVNRADNGEYVERSFAVTLGAKPSSD